MSKFVIKIVSDGHTFLTSADVVEVWEQGDKVGYPPRLDLYENGKVREQINLEYVCTAYIENLSGRTVKMVHGTSSGLVSGDKSVSSNARAIGSL